MNEFYLANTRVNIKDSYYFDGCIETVQTGAVFKLSMQALSWLHNRAKRCLNAHNERVLALGVHRRERHDGLRSGVSGE